MMLFCVLLKVVCSVLWCVISVLYVRCSVCMLSGFVSVRCLVM